MIAHRIRGFARPIVWRTPLLRTWLRERKFRREFPNERLLLAGRHQPASDERSLVCFTLHKCASNYVGTALRRLSAERGLTAIDFDAYHYLGGPAPFDLFSPHPELLSVYRNHGYFFGPFRHFNPGIPNLGSFRVVLSLRDPRDVLTSLYFSVAFSHYVPEENPREADMLRARRGRTLQMGIDEFVAGEAPQFVERYRAYRRELLGKPNVLLVRYEEMVERPDEWLESLAEFIGVDPAQPVVRSIAAERVNRVRSEDARRHLRQVSPGDHRKKLRPETVELLNREFQDTLEALGYSLDRG